MSIPVKKRKTAHKVLQLLAFDNSFGRMSSNPDTLAEAVVVDVEQLSFKPEYRFLDRNALFEICTCLIMLTADGKVIIAHYSVKEYLISKRIQHSPAAAFQISPVAHYVLWLKSSLVYLLDITYDGLCSAKDYKCLEYDGEDSEDEKGDEEDEEEYLKDRKQGYHVRERTNFPFLAWAHHWHWKIRESGMRFVEELDKVIINGLVERLLNPNGSHYQGWLESTQIHMSQKKVGFFPRWKTGPGLEPSLSLAYACYFALLESAKLILDLNPDLDITQEQLELDLENSFNGSEHDLPSTAVELAIIYPDVEILELLLERGADPNGVNAGGDCRLLYALEVSGRESIDLVQVLLKAGADPNPRGVALTPLQAATMSHDAVAVGQLLEAGAHVNAVGDDEAVVAAIQRDCGTEVGRFSQVGIEEWIRTRGILSYYQTPLRILGEHEVGHTGNMIKDILIDYGGKSLNLFPIKDLPGYEEADFHALSKNGVDEVEERLETNDFRSEGNFESEGYSD